MYLIKSVPDRSDYSLFYCFKVYRLVGEKDGKFTQLLKLHASDESSVHLNKWLKCKSDNLALEYTDLERLLIDACNGINFESELDVVARVFDGVSLMHQNYVLSYKL